MYRFSMNLKSFFVSNVNLIAGCVNFLFALMLFILKFEDSAKYNTKMFSVMFI